MTTGRALEAVTIEFSQHADMLARGIHNLGLVRDGEHLFNAADWFFAASSTVKVDCITSQHDDSILWCSPAAEYEDRRSKLWAAHLTELARFTFCWTGFECLSKGLFSKTELRKGLMPALTERFKGFKPAELSNSILRDHLIVTSEMLAEKLKNLNYPEDNNQKALDKLRFAKFPGQGAIEAIKSIRNAFAHGGVSLPFPEDDNEIADENMVTEVISLSNTLLLIVSQYLMFLSSTLDERSMDVALPYVCDDEVSLGQVLLAGGSLDFCENGNRQLDLFN